MSFRTVFGIILVVIGGGFFLDQMGVLDFGVILGTWWPLIIILIGALQLVTRSVPWPAGVFVVVLGVLFQIAELEIFDINFGQLIWPAILILAGIYLVFGRSLRSPGTVHTESDLDRLIIFGGMEDRIEAHPFKGGSITTMFGGAELDLRHSTIDPSGAELDVTCAFGGVELAVPPEWDVKITGLPLFGGWDNKTRPAAASEDPRPTLRVRCMVAFGGVEIHN